MDDEDVRELAHLAGIANDWIDANEQPQRVAIEPLKKILAALGYPCATTADLADSQARLLAETPEVPPLITATVGTPITVRGASRSKDIAGEVSFENGAAAPITIRARDNALVVPPIEQSGYHRLRFGDREITLAVAPARCITMNDIAPGEKLWGIAVQIYALRRAGDSGIGDTGALRDFAKSAAHYGADAIALSPTHSLFHADPSHYGPYSPSSRLFLNPLFADPATLFDESRVAAARRKAEPAEHAKLDQTNFIDWTGAARAKYGVLLNLFEDFRTHELTQPTNALASDFSTFVRQGADQLRAHALFEALHQHWLGVDEPLWNWSEWSAPWRDPSSAEVSRHAEAENQTLQFHLFLQWLAARSFAAAQQEARQAGMRVGLIADLAIGMSPGGSHAWARQKDLLLGLNIGAPPDKFNARGQDWGLTGFSPRALVAGGFEPFLATLRAVMRYAGGVRIDHVMGLARLWLIPQGSPPGEGAYLTYPLDDLLRLIALESHRHRAIVIGEDLGTVPPAFRAQMSEAGIAGLDVMWFQREGIDFLAPEKWRADAVAMTTTHDLPTVAGWWQGTDIAIREDAGLVPDRDAEIAQRGEDRSALWRAFGAAQVSAGDEPLPEASAKVVDAAVAFVAHARSALAIVPIEDVLGLTAQPNLPGTIDEYPNWRSRLDTPASDILDKPEAKTRLNTLRERRR